jgi:hypothetical protein
MIMISFFKDTKISSARNDPYSSPKPGEPVHEINYRCPICQADVRESMRACCLTYRVAIAQAETPVV